MTDANGKKLKANRDYTIVGYYVAQTTYRIAAKNLSKTQVSVKPMIYNEGEVELTEQMIEDGHLTVYDKTAKKYLKYNDEYIITGYKNNTKKGTATLTIQGIGEYGGTKTVKFKIVANPLKKN